ncbi:MAG TPA: hypothetical protein VK432_03430, partial [Stellaceae bacterium]|nr:hypothetical protein [Stellaceae bacterium]
MIVVAAIIIFAALIALGGLTLRERARLSEAERARDAAETALAWAAANLVTAPLIGFLWRGRTGEAIAIASGTESFAEFIAAFDADAASLIEAAIAALRTAGTPFDMTATRCGGGAVALAGRRSRSGDALLWVTDTSALRALETAQQESAATAAALRAMFEAVPVPVWRRDRSLTLV